MKFLARLKRLENRIITDKIPLKIANKYTVLTYDEKLNPEQAKEKATNELSSSCNISIEKARTYMEESTLIFLPDNGRNSHES